MRRSAVPSSYKLSKIGIPAAIPAVQILQTVLIVRNTQSEWSGTTKSSSENTWRTNVTASPGDGPVTTRSTSLLSVGSVWENGQHVAVEEVHRVVPLSEGGTHIRQI